MAAEEDLNAQFLGVYQAIVDAYDASVVKTLEALLGRIYEDVEFQPSLSHFLRHNLVKLFGDTLVDAPSGLRHRQRWAKRTVSEQEDYVRAIIKCLQAAPQDDSLVTSKEREALDKLEKDQGWTGNGKAPMPQ